MNQTYHYSVLFNFNCLLLLCIFTTILNWEEMLDFICILYNFSKQLQTLSLFLVLLQQNSLAKAYCFVRVRVSKTAGQCMNSSYM